MPKERILVVDDEPDVLRVCERILSADGYTVTTVGNGFEAVQLAGSEPFDLLLTDIKMPGMDGLDVAEAARIVNPHLVCVTMTGYSTMDTAIEALKLGVEEFIIKPFAPKDLLTSVSRALEKERLRRESARLRALLPLFEANQLFMSTMEVEKLSQQVLMVASRETKADRAVLILNKLSDDSDENEVIPTVVTTFALPAEDKSKWEKIVTMVDGQESAVSLDASTGKGMSLAAELGAVSVIAASINSKQGSIGALILTSDRPENRFSEGDREFVSVLSGQAGIAIQNAHLFEQLRKAYEELKQLDYMKSEFISIAAHELRTPLAILMGYAGILESMVPGDVKQYATIIVRNAGRLRALMDEMLNLEALERGSSLVRLEAVNAAELIQEIIEDIEPLAKAKHQVLQLHSPVPDTRLTTDREKFAMILTNLLSNAVKFTPDGGKISVIAGEQPDGLLVQVSDTGIGIAKEHWQRIFERFYQVEDSLTREHEGMGLGLSIAKGMAELLGGKIWLESELEQGSTFFFLVPKTPKQTPTSG